LIACSDPTAGVLLGLGAKNPVLSLSRLVRRVARNFFGGAKWNQIDNRNAHGWLSRTLMWRQDIFEWKPNQLEFREVTE
jgi:hypothetical protein